MGTIHNMRETARALFIPWDKTTVEVACKAAYGTKPVCPSHRLYIDRHSRPGHCGISCDCACPDPVEVVDKALEHTVVAAEFKSERPSNLQVLLSVSMQPVHDCSPGQGRATSARASKSSLAYTAVVNVW